MNINADSKCPSLTSTPITIGTAMADRLPMKLNIPPVRRIRLFGASAETNAQVIDAMPFPKNARSAVHDRLQARRHRPSAQQDGIQDARLDAIDEHPAWDLQNRVRPAECRKNQSELHRTQIQVTSE